MIYKKYIYLNLSSLLILSLLLLNVPKAYAAACSEKGLGSASNAYSVPYAGNKQIWLRMAGTNANSKSINVEVKDSNNAITCLKATNSTPSVNWTWIRAGGLSGQVSLSLNNNLTLYGLDDGVRVDKIVAFDATRSCTPSNVFPGTLGDECLDPSSPPVPSVTDTTPPVGPASLSLSTQSVSQVNLSWPKATDNIGVTSYEIYRNGTKINMLSPQTTTYADSGLTAATSYTYKVVARDAAGNTSTGAQSSISTQQISDTTSPTVPSSITNGLSLDVAATAYYVNLNWTASSDAGGIKNYEIFRDGVSIGFSPNTSFRDYNLKPDVYFSYEVRAIDNSGNTSAKSVRSVFVGRCFLWFCWKG